MILKIALTIIMGIVTILQPLLIDQCGQPDRDVTPASFSLETGLSMRRVLIEGDFHRPHCICINCIALAIQESRYRKRSVLIKVIVSCVVEPSRWKRVGHYSLGQPSFRDVECRYPIDLFGREGLDILCYANLRGRSHVGAASVPIAIVIQGYRHAFTVDLFHVNHGLVCDVVAVRRCVVVGDGVGPARVAMIRQLGIANVACIHKGAVLVADLYRDAITIVLHVVGGTC